MFAAQCAHSNTLTAHFISNTEHQAHRTHYTWNICMQIAISQTIRFYTYAYVSSRQKYAALPFYGFQLSSKWKKKSHALGVRECNRFNCLLNLHFHLVFSILVQYSSSCLQHFSRSTNLDGIKIYLHPCSSLDSMDNMTCLFSVNKIISV